MRDDPFMNMQMIQESVQRDVGEYKEITFII